MTRGYTQILTELAEAAGVSEVTEVEVVVKDGGGSKELRSKLSIEAILYLDKSGPDQE